MAKRLIMLALLCKMVVAQNAQATPQATQPATTPATSPIGNVAPDAPVIILHGVCDHPQTEKPGPDCKTVITRAQFESMVQTVQPNLPAGARRDFAEKYVEALVADEQARDMGITQGGTFQMRLRIARAQAMAQELGVALHEEASKVSDKDIEDYYRENPDLFVEANLSRMLVPGIQQLPAPEKPLSAPEQEKRNQESEALMKDTAEKLRLRAAAGEGLDKLQAEAFQIAMVTGEAPNTNLNKVRGTDLPANQVTVMELKPGEVSGLLLDRRGYLIYKMGDKKVIPLAAVKDDIRKRIADQRFQAETDAIMNASKISLDETYFGK
jgi:hypothetical protein